MKTLLIAVSVVSMFAACRSNSKTDKDLAGTSSSAIIDSSEFRALPDGTKRVKVIETHNVDGSRTVTTTTDMNAKSSPVSTTSKPRSQPVVIAPVPSAPPVVTTTTVEKKKGWSSRAKGAAIGGVSGAAAGAIISKNKVAGAVIGGAVGAGGGYIIGNEIDRNKTNP